MTELLGWASSAVLFVTLATQIGKQWREGTGRGVSKWLYVGQIVASAGFAVYSLLVENWVFVVTNSALLVTAVLGFGLTWRGQRAAEEGSENENEEARPVPFSPLGAESANQLGTDDVH